MTRKNTAPPGWGANDDGHTYRKTPLHALLTNAAMGVCSLALWGSKSFPNPYTFDLLGIALNLAALTESVALTERIPLCLLATCCTL